MNFLPHAFVRFFIFLTAFLFCGFSVCRGQSAYQILLMTGKLSEDKAPVRIITRQMQAPAASSALANRVVSLKGPMSLCISSASHLLSYKKYKIEIPCVNIVAKYKVPPLQSPSSLWGSYHYLHLLTIISRTSAAIDPAYKEQWKVVPDSAGYRGVHHIVNKTTLRHIYKDMKEASQEKKEFFAIKFSDLHNDSPGSLHPFHGKNQFSHIFHNSSRQLELYEEGGIKLIVLDYFKSLRQLALQYPQEAPAIPAEVVKNTLLESKLWCETFQLRWE